MTSLYSPLEQFEPIPLLLLFLGGINFSITNVTIIFIYIVLVFCYFLNGYLFRLNDAKLVKFSHPKAGTLRLGGKTQFDYLNKFYNNLSERFFLFNTSTHVPFLIFLSDSHRRFFGLTKLKVVWLGLNTLAPFNFKRKYYNDLGVFNFIFFAGLREKNFIFCVDNFIFIKKYFQDTRSFKYRFLFTLYDLCTFLDFKNLKNELSALNVLYFFTTRENYVKSFISNFNIFVFENIYKVILGMVKDNIGGGLKRAVRFFPFVFSLFIFVLVANLIGLVPYSSTVTSYLIITFALAIMVLFGVHVLSERAYGSIMSLGHFLPGGCPFLLYPLIIPIEAISYIFRVISLSVRLFANMMAGHTLLAVLAGFGWVMANTNVSLFTHQFLPLLVVTGLVFLETAVAIIQAYVFTILTCMYLDEAINRH